MPALMISYLLQEPLEQKFPNISAHAMNFMKVSVLPTRMRAKKSERFCLELICLDQ